MSETPAAKPAIPRVVLAYGLAGLIPFLAPPAAGLIWPAAAGFAATLLGLYGALILSFLGGARFGVAVIRPAAEGGPSLLTVSLSMLPTLAALGIVLVTPQAPAARLIALAAALALHWVWDIRSGGLPSWYPQLRTLLTVGAVTGLLAGALLPGG